MSKYLTFLIFSATLAFPLASPVFAAEKLPPNNAGFQSRAASVLILNDNSSELAGKASDVVRPIASLTKLMTAIVLLDNGLDFSKTATYTPEKHYAYKNYMNIKRGEVFRVSDLWFGMLTGSLNVETRMLVDAVGIPETTFVNKMNIKASVLGLEYTKFFNVTGLSADLVRGQKAENVSTARELAALFQEALKYPQIAGALSLPAYRFEEVVDKDKKTGHYFHHTNKLMQEALPYRIVASKTGYTEEAGACFVTLTTSRAGNHLIVSLGDPNYQRRFDEPKRLAEWALLETRVRAAGQ
ncbi:hypothetical protein A3H75_03165 [Candidatus Uhrbacteria bacterium RIFCSPLOWO2_02_FULL_51_9]|uniref:Peptidase S11 D-alanyl-D-alanine carboxypeptidase A N-terminal domain-containing protein n=1 Tax=Candidatus Uhrbacteria bacterium RIFCSPLOWO2_02_FULL_51_9 TaxID=1802410 RepID=A0A1F7VFV8_9BACT|nr:MAG: hypothetical protein A3H75_03165 [Candidatus Uhrbacteria bacterium RIFCSPLOWO2_02_FULL_51_9]